MKIRGIILVFISVLICSFVSSSQQIGWSISRPLQWADYKGPADLSSPFKANTMGAMNYAVAKPIEEGVTVSIKVLFYPEHSWVKPGAQTKSLLVHEQRHFDIWEAHARLLVSRLVNDTTITRNNYQYKIDAHFNAVMEILKKVQNDYDRDTDHSINKDQQEQWNQKIDNVLLSMQRYALREVRIRFQ